VAPSGDPSFGASHFDKVLGWQLHSSDIRSKFEEGLHLHMSKNIVGKLLSPGKWKGVDGGWRRQ